MNTVRYGIIGIGNMGTTHAKNLYEGKIENAVLAAICDINPDRLAWANETLPGVATYETAEIFFEKAEVDAVIIATPHYFHPIYAIKAFEKGLNVLTEKPAGVYTKAVREMNEAAEKAGLTFGIMYNQRTNPVYAKVRDMIRSGELGEIKRVIWLITDWYRSQSYYNSSSWRATWEGEGGGVLLNQCPHQLDLWQWMCGMPCEIRSFMEYGKGRNIEVENDVTTYVKYPNGATGVFISSTHDTPGTNRLEITGDLGKLVVERSAVTFYKNKMGEAEFNATHTGGFGEPGYDVINVEITEKETGHNGILQNYTNAILNGEELLAPGCEGIRGLSISNAMHMSALLGKAVELPVDEDAYYEELMKRVATSRRKEGVKAVFADTSDTYGGAKK